MKIILASGSPRRRELFSKLDIPFEIMVSDLEEHSDKKEPDLLVMDLASQKAHEIWNRISGQGKEGEDILVLGADTIVWQDGRILGKPKDEEEAFCMISTLSGKSHEVYTGVCLLGRVNGKDVDRTFCERTKVNVINIQEEEIWNYIRLEQPLDKAGAYGIQEGFAMFVEGIEGDYNNVVGLPLCRIHQELNKIIRKK